MSKVAQFKGKITKKIYTKIKSKQSEKHGVNFTGDRVLYYPVITDIEQLKTEMDKLTWYIPDSNINIDILVTERVHNESYQFKKSKEGPNFKFIESKSLHFEKYSLVLLHKANSIFKPSLYPYLFKTLIVDPWFYSTTEVENFRNAYSLLMDKNKKEEYLNKSIENFKKLVKKNNFTRSSIIATGPSIEEAYKYDFKDSFVISCNSIVKNNELLEHLGINAVAFADPAFHFGPSEYAKEFRMKLIESIKKYNVYAIIPLNYVPLIIKNHPEIKDNIIGIPVKKKEFNIPNIENFYVQETSNILSLFMLPIAATVSDNIEILGADGRNPKDKNFWRHNKTTQFSNLMGTLERSHPSFHRDRDYEGYYEEHNKNLEMQISYLEKLKISITSLTNSYIPSLYSRRYSRKE